MTWGVRSDLCNREDTAWNWRLVDEMYRRLDDGYETWQGNGLEIVQCCNFARFRIYIPVSAVIHLMQRRRYFIFCIVPQSVVQLESIVLPSAQGRGYSVSSMSCFRQTKLIEKSPQPCEKWHLIRKGSTLSTVFFCSIKVVVEEVVERQMLEF